MTVRVEGIGEAVKELNEILSQRGKQTKAGLRAAGLLIQRRAQKRVPVEYGKLRASSYTRTALSGGISVEIGFSAEYALYVHENMQVNAGRPRRSGIGEVWGPAGEPKYLEKALRETQPEIASIVARYMGK